MNWTEEAEKAISKVPFFVKGRVKKKIEEEAIAVGSEIVKIEHVNKAHNKFMDNQEDEVKGYKIEACFGGNGCPNTCNEKSNLIEKLEKLDSLKGLKDHLKSQIKGKLKIHNEFRITIADCPNSCSRPQIVDIGILGAIVPGTNPDLKCSECGSCVEACEEGAVTLMETWQEPVIDLSRCINCGDCIRACGTSFLTGERCGYKILVGGKLGRHPQLGREIPGIFSEDEVLSIVDRIVEFYKKNSEKGERLGSVLNRLNIDYKKLKNLEFLK